MSQTPIHSPWPRRLGLGLTVLLALDAAMLAVAANIPAVREQTSRLVPTLSYSYADDDGSEEGFRYLYGEPAGRNEDGWSMSGTFNTRRMGFLRSERAPFVWFGDDKSEYLVRDPDIVVAAREITRPVRENGAEMGRIGGQQGRIGGQQGRLGGQQGMLGARLGALAARRATAALAGDDRAGDRLDAEIEEVQRKLERQPGELEQQMRPLAREQERLGRIQSELGHKQQELVKVETRKMRELLERAKREGKAVRLHADA